MLNLWGLATSVHYNITIPEAIGDPNQPSPVYFCVISPCYYLFSGDYSPISPMEVSISGEDGRVYNYFKYKNYF